MKRKISSMLAVILMVGLLGSTVSAATVATGEITADYAVNFTGTIQATILSATIPTTVAFDLDPTKDADTPPKMGQITQPALEIVNHSIVPIDIKIKDVAVQINEEPKSNILLADDGDGTLTGQQTLFGLKTQTPADWSDTDVTDDDEKDWLTTDSAKAGYRVLPKNTALDTDKTIPVFIYGKTGKGWKVNETILIQPTFVISAADTTYTNLVGTTDAQ